MIEGESQLAKFALLFTFTDVLKYANIHEVQVQREIRLHISKNCFCLTSSLPALNTLVNIWSR